MFKLSSRSATVLVIFIVACIAFCAASVFASMTGTITILPNESDGGVLDNLSAITDSDDNYNTYGYDDSNSYEQSYSSDDSSDDDNSQVETTTEESSHTTTQTDSHVETTTDSSGSSSGSSSSSSGDVETTTAKSDK